MTSPNVPIERIDHFRSRLKQGDEDTVISRAHLGDVKIYLAHAVQDGAAGAASRGYLAMRENDTQRDILFLQVPEVRPEDPLAPKRALALLAFSALLEDQYAHKWTDETSLTVVNTEPDTEPLLRDVLNMEPQGLLARTAISSAMGRLHEVLNEVQAYRAPYPHQVGPMPWLADERTA